MSEFLVVTSILAVVYGILSLSQATMGVGLVGAALWLGVMARLAQSRAQHRETLKALAPPPEK